MDMYTKYSLLVRVFSENTLEVWGASAGSRIAVFGQPSSIRMDSGGEWGNGIPTDFCSGRNVRLRFHGKGARPWPLGRRNGSAWDVYNRLAANGRFSSRANLHGVQFRLDAMRCHGGVLAHQMIIWPCVCGAAATATWSLRRIRQFRGSEPTSGKCARRHRKRHCRKQPLAAVGA